MPSVLETDAPPNSDIEEKRLQRRMVERHIQAALLKNHAQNGSSVVVTPRNVVPPVAEEGGTTINVLLFDHWLDGDGLFTERLLSAAEFRDRLRIYSPNVRPDVVRALSALPHHGRVTTGLGCFHHCLRHWESQILHTGGFHVVMADVSTGGRTICLLPPASTAASATDAGSSWTS